MSKLKASKMKNQKNFVRTTGSGVFCVLTQFYHLESYATIIPCFVYYNGSLTITPILLLPLRLQLCWESVLQSDSDHVTPLLTRWLPISLGIKGKLLDMAFKECSVLTSYPELSSHFLSSTHFSLLAVPQTDQAHLCLCSVALRIPQPGTNSPEIGLRLLSCLL